MDRPEFIKKIEGDKLLSVLTLGKHIIPKNIFDNKNLYVLMYVDSSFKNNQLTFKEKIIKTTHGFYIHLQKFDDEEQVNMKVYHEPEQTNELIIYIKQLLKQF